MDPVNVSVSKLVNIDEDNYFSDIQFEMRKDARARYQKIKERASVNPLRETDYAQLWLLEVIYEKTDQKETTRLGSNWEWKTRVIVKF